MNVLQVTSSAPPRTGGLEQHVWHLSRGLDDRGHDVTVLSADAGTDPAAAEDWNGVAVRRVRGLAPGNRYHVAPGIARAVRRADADVVHAHNYHSLPLLFASLGVTDERFVVTPHYHGASAGPVRNRLLRLYRPLGRRALASADALVAVSEWERGRLREDFDLNATVVPNGVDPERFRDATPEPRDRPYLLTVGRLEPYKGIQHAIRALAHPDLAGYDLVVAGTGPHRDRLEQIATDAGVEDRVSFPGFVPDETLPGLYAGAEVFVSLSAFEAYGLAVSEALAAGTPCVLRDAGALTDWTGRADCVGVTDLSASSIAAAVLAARDRPVAADTVPSWAAVVDQIEAIYRNRRATS